MVASKAILLLVELAGVAIVLTSPWSVQECL